jgi:3-isopropylmalate/(R)-2-methylmalate dehydratase large subunit
MKTMQQNKKTIIDKIWEQHEVITVEGHPTVFAIDLMLMHEVTSAQAFAELRKRNLSVKDTTRLIATLDHSIPTRKDRFVIHDVDARIQVETLRNNCKEYGIPLFDFDSGKQGIVHVIGPELGLTHPGMTIVCGDSHTSTHGAFGALAFGVGTSEVGHVLATGCILLKKPKTMEVLFEGTLSNGVFAKDMVLKLIKEIGISGGNGHVAEFRGELIKNLSMEERMTICNMSIEFGARAGLVSPDEVTFKFLQNKNFAPKENNWEKAINYWKNFVTDKDAKFDKSVTINCTSLKPMITWGTNPEQAISIEEKIPFIKELPETHQQTAKLAIEYTGLKEGEKIEGTPVDWAFLGSCTNGRIEDLRIAAKILDGRKVSSSTTFYIVPGSEEVLRVAKQEGLVEIFESAGAVVRNPGCSMCLGMNDDKVPSGARCISSSNRNFVGRQGPGSRTHLASPATVASSAIAGKIVSPVEYL